MRVGGDECRNCLFGYVERRRQLGCWNGWHWRHQRRGASSGGTSSGGTSDGGSLASGGSGGDRPATGGDGGWGGVGGLGGASSWGSCAPDERGTSVAEGTCHLINDFEGDVDVFGSQYELDSDGRQGAGVDVDPGSGLPRLSGGSQGSGSGSLEVRQESEENSFLRFSFADAEDWGGAFAYMISNDACYDASAYSGVRFRVRVDDPGDVKFAVATADSSPLYDCSPEEDCYNAAQTILQVGTQWLVAEVHWDDLRRPNWGQDKNEAIDPTRILAFIFADGGEEEYNSIRLDIDDLEFIGGDASSCELADGQGGAGGANSSD